MARKPQDDPKLDMTPMIDVVFELIIFFVVTIKQEDIYSKLNANRPAPGKSSSSDSDVEPFNIQIGKDSRNYRDGVYIYNGTYMGSGREGIAKLEPKLAEQARKTAKPEELPIVIKCEMSSPHKALVDLLDCCYKYRLYSVSVFSM